jgi:hypothetical protein
MKSTHRRLLLTSLSALTLAAPLAVLNGCKPKTASAPDAPSAAAVAKSLPAPFTGTLTEIDGIQAVYTLRHPKLILADLDKLMAAVPEAALARMFLGQLTPYGYPEFSELAADANFGVVMLTLDPAALETAQPTFIGFAKLKENGKIWTALTQAGLTLEKRGEWTCIGKNPTALAQLKSIDALTAYLARPQTEEIRAWGRVSPALLARAKELLWTKLTAHLATRPAEEQKALTAYAEIAWSYLAQLHSAGGSLDLNDQGITFAYSGQFLPDSPVGTYLRHAPGPDPKIAASVPADAPLSIVARYNIPATMELFNTVIDRLIAVDYPTYSEPLKVAKKSYNTSLAQSDGGAVLTMTATFPNGLKAPAIDMLGVQSGQFTSEQVAARCRTNIEFTNTFLGLYMDGLGSLTPKQPLPKIKAVLTENILTINGIPFSEVTTTTTTQGAGEPPIATQNTYFGAVAGNLVYGTSEASLRAKLPALIAGNPVADPVTLNFKTHDIIVAALHGDKLVDMVATAAHADLADADIQAQIATFKTAYAAAAPVTMSIASAQAEAVVAINIPYVFIAQSVRLGQFASAAAKAPAQK